MGGCTVSVSVVSTVWFSSRIWYLTQRLTHYTCVAMSTYVYVCTYICCLFHIFGELCSTYKFLSLRYYEAHIRTYICTYTYMCTYAHVHIRKFEHMSSYINGVNMHTSICMYVCMYCPLNVTLVYHVLVKLLHPVCGTCALSI